MGSLKEGREPPAPLQLFGGATRGAILGRGCTKPIRVEGKRKLSGDRLRLLRGGP